MQDIEYKQRTKDYICKCIDDAEAKDIVLDAEGITEAMNNGSAHCYNFIGKQITLKIYVKAEALK